MAKIAFMGADSTVSAKNIIGSRMYSGHRAIWNLRSAASSRADEGGISIMVTAPLDKKIAGINRMARLLELRDASTTDLLPQGAQGLASRVPLIADPPQDPNAPPTAVGGALHDHNPRSMHHAYRTTEKPMNQTKLYAPAYYREFTCIADKCRHTCCVGWEIDVDDDTYEIYKTFTDGYGARIRESIDAADGETPHFHLAEGDRCPHLASSGLCHIISELGEGYLCDICREHPRFYHNTPRGVEVGLGMACEEACRLILDSDGYADFEVIDELGGCIDDEPGGDFAATAHRAALYAILSDRSLPYSERLNRISTAWRVTPTVFPDNGWQIAFADLEYLDDSHRALFSHYTSCFGHTSPVQEVMLERALAYFVYRHASHARTEREFRSAVGFSLLCERLLASISALTDGGIREAARIVSEELEYSEENTAALMQIFRAES